MRDIVRLFHLSNERKELVSYRQHVEKMTDHFGSGQVLANRVGARLFIEDSHEKEIKLLAEAGLVYGRLMK